MSNETLLPTTNSVLSSRSVSVACGCLFGDRASRQFELAAGELYVRQKMSKLACNCGEILSNSMSPNEVEGDIISHKGYSDLSNFIEEVTADFIQHKEAGDLEPWLVKHFNKVYPRTCTPGQMIGDAVASFFSSRTLDIWECDNCGSLLIQRSHEENSYVTYSPDQASDRIKVLGDNKPTSGEPQR